MAPEQAAEEPGVKIIGILEKLTSIVNKNIEPIEAAVVAHFSKQLEELENISLEPQPKAVAAVEPAAVEPAAVEPAAVEHAAVVEEKIPAAETEAVDSDEDSCPIEPFLEDSDKEEAEEAKKETKSSSIQPQNDTAQAAQAAVPKPNDDVDDADSDDDSCPIEPFLEDSDKEVEEIKEEAVIKKSWANIAAVAKVDEPAAAAAVEKPDDKVAAVHDPPSVVVVEDVKPAEPEDLVCVK